MKKKRTIHKGRAMTLQTKIYIVRKDDTLWGISKKFDINIDLLATENGLKGKAAHTLHPGQKLRLPNISAENDCELTLRIVDLIRAPIAFAKLKLSFDGKEKEFTTNVGGEVGPILIDDHAKGLKVRLQNIEGKYELIDEHKVLPLGKKSLIINSRQILIKSRYWTQQGKQDATTSQLQKKIKHKNQDIHAQPTDGKRPRQQSKTPPTRLPEPLITETRLEGGNPTHIVATVFADENLYLIPANEKYRKFIIASAKKYGFTPHALAALIHAEAAKLRGGEWNADSKNEKTNAAGLTQFMSETWLEMCTDSRSFMNIRLTQENGYEKISGKREGGIYVISGRKGQTHHRIATDPALRWRFDAEYAIDSAALYGQINLDRLRKRGINIDSLEPEDLAKAMYFAHHEGAHGAAAIVKGTLTAPEAEKLLKAQIKEKADAYIARFNREPVKAYVHWLFSYVDSNISITQFMVNPAGFRARSMEEICKTLGLPAGPPSPNSKEVSLPFQLPTEQAGAAMSWQDPLDECTIRTALLASRRSATFGMVRNGGTKAHQGIDLVAKVGTPVYAVANGRIKRVIRAFAVTTGYGAAITLQVDVNDLPAKQRQYYQSKYPNNELVHFYYAHLSSINVQEGSYVKSGEILGKTGDSGNAKGMDSIANGGHLHFESRHSPNISTGLDGRMDPLPFLNRCS
ncbi:peptidoglycan DD-metalloendopeptidase family protein [Noviherbaspirillum cavernae]|uniref:peptidoglycan DD-metalloendopeptidase family protein n=1 Tax=Noviherbaspirillum cavernae TaxID=2320862 RepID=UPI0013148614|nr:peptidoglycan DD-metalloendopeptidase family protein [Noviherbaspirillum cavernae]